MELNQNTEKLDNYRKRAAELVGKMTLEEKVAQTREFDTLKCKKVPQSLEIGLFFCQIFIFII